MTAPETHCGHDCCDTQTDPHHNHFLAAKDCPSCLAVVNGHVAEWIASQTPRCDQCGKPDDNLHLPSIDGAETALCVGCCEAAGTCHYETEDEG